MAKPNGIKQKIWTQAQLLGEMYFYVPGGCINGHDEYFYTSNGHCSRCHKIRMKKRYHP
jgi:hypothetical protein